MDVGGEGGVDVQNLFAGDGVHAHHRVRHGRVLGASGLQLFAAGILAQQVLGPAGDLPGVHGTERFQIGFEVGGQACVGGGHAGPDGVATAGRNDLRIQAGACGWIRLPSDVGVPVVVGCGALGGAFHNLYLGLAFHPWEKSLDLMDLAKTAGERHLLFWCERLVPKKDHLVLGQGRSQLSLSQLAQWLRQVQTMERSPDIGGVGFG